MSKKKNKIRFALSILFAAILAFSLSRICLQIPEYSSEKESIKRAVEVARGEERGKVVEETPSELIPDETSLPANENLLFLASMDIEKLQVENQDVIGWLLIPGTEISYPLLKAENNEYYLSHTWDNQKNSCGSIFYDYRSSPRDWNSVIYGHNMRNGSMFAPLHQYKDEDFSVKNNKLLILYDGEIKEYSFVTAFEAELDGVPYVFGKASKEEKSAFVKTLSEKSGVKVSTNSSFVTLSTCTGLGHKTRWVVIFSADNQQALVNNVYLNERM